MKSCKNHLPSEAELAGWGWKFTYTYPIFLCIRCHEYYRYSYAFDAHLHMTQLDFLRSIMYPKLESSVLTWTEASCKSIVDE